MKEQQIPPRAQLKFQARQTLVHRIRPCMIASGIFLILQLAALYFEMNTGGVFGYYLLSATDYTTATGIWLAEGGFTAVLRIDPAGILFALPLSFGQLGTFILIRLVVFVVTVPLLMGVLEQYQAVIDRQDRPLSALFRWYADIRMTAKAVAVELVLALVKWGTRLAAAVPGLLLFLWATDSGSLSANIVSILIVLAALLVLAGGIASYGVYTLVLPAQYLLIREPDASVGHILSYGVRVFRGLRWNYLLFRLSFLLWYILINATYGTLGLFVQPYAELSNLLYLQSVLFPGQARSDLENP